METGIISDIQKFSLHDGPGIRTTVFLKGCPLTCEWCHNPETQAEGPVVVRVAGRCIRCGSCVQSCPEGIPADSGESPVEPDVICGLCGRCVDICPTGARQQVGRLMSVDEVVDEVSRDSVFYDESGGGVTFSGGEPLHQFRFLKDLLEACRKRNIHTAVDTCGYSPTENLEQIAANTDLFLFDLKVMDPKKHLERTGVSNDSILENLIVLNRIHESIWIRIPVVPGFNDSPEDFQAMASFLAPLSAISQINLLPYHKMGHVKQARLGRVYRLNRLDTPAEDELRPLSELFAGSGLRVVIGG